MKEHKKKQTQLQTQKGIRNKKKGMGAKRKQIERNRTRNKQN